MAIGLSALACWWSVAAQAQPVDWVKIKTAAFNMYLPKAWQFFGKKPLDEKVKWSGAWTFGSADGKALYGPSASPALFGLDLSSPFLMEVSRGVIDLKKAALNRNEQRKWVSSTNWIKCAGFQYSDEHWQHSVPGGGRNAPGSKVAGADRPDWRPSRQVGLGGGGRGGAVLNMVGGLVGKLIDLVLPGLSKAIDRVRDMSHAAVDFLQKWAGKIIAVAKTTWNKGKKLIAKSQETIGNLEKNLRDKLKEMGEAKAKAGELILEATQKGQELIKEAMANVGQAEIANVVGKGAASVAQRLKDAKDKLKEAKSKAKELVQDAKQKAKDLIKEAQGVTKEAGKTFDQFRKDWARQLKGLKKSNKAIPGSGEFLGQILQDLSNKILARVMQIVSPRARSLLQKGFRFVRTVLGAVAKAVISALGSIPFVGGALAVLGQIAYDMALNRLEEFAYERLLGVVERVMAKALRSLLSPIMKAVQGQLSKMVHSACMAFGVCTEDGQLKFASLPKRDRWLNRALACRRGPVIDRRIRRRAVHARLEIINMGQRLRRRAPMLARRLANQHLAQFGISLNDVLAAARGDRKMLAFARLDQVKRALARGIRQLRGQVEKKR